MKPTITLFFSFRLLASLLVFSAWGCHTETASDAPAEGNVEMTSRGLGSGDGSGDDHTYFNFSRQWDTGELSPEEQCVYLSDADCLAAKGRFSVETPEHQCVDGETRRCCLVDSLSNPCPWECQGAHVCAQFDGTIHPTSDGSLSTPESDTDSGSGSDTDPGDWECPHRAQICCEPPPGGFVYPDPPSEGVAFDAATCTDCPSDTDIVTASAQPDQIASGICMELKDVNSDWFCPQADYDRIVRDMEAIKASYLNEVPRCWLSHQVHNGFNEEIIPYDILCASGATLVPPSCTRFSKEGWQGLMDGLGASGMRCVFEDEEAGTCGQVHLNFDVGANTKRMLPIVEAHAQSLVYGSVCELDTQYGVTGPLLEGFHPRDNGGGNWEWDVRVAGDRDLYAYHCDLRLTVATTTDPGSLTLLAVDNWSDAFCDAPGFDVESF